MLKPTPKTKHQQPLAGPVYTTEPDELPPVNPIVTTPFYIRLPKSGTACGWTGLSKSALNALILGKNPPVKSVSLRQPHAIRGIRLILLSSLLEYIAGVAEAQQTTNSAAATAVVEDVDAKTRRAAKTKPRATRNKQ